MGPGRDAGGGTCAPSTLKPQNLSPHNPRLSPFAAPNSHRLRPQTITICSPSLSPFVVPNHCHLQPQTIAICHPKPLPFAAPLHPPLQPQCHITPPAPFCLGDSVYCATDATTGATATTHRAGGTPGHRQTCPGMFRWLLPGTSWQWRQPGEAKPVWRDPAQLPGARGTGALAGQGPTDPAHPRQCPQRDARGPGCFPHRPDRSWGARGPPIPPRRGFGRLLCPKGQPLAPGLASPSSPPSHLSFFLFFKPKSGSAVA